MCKYEFLPPPGMCLPPCLPLLLPCDSVTMASPHPDQHVDDMEELQNFGIRSSSDFPSLQKYLNFDQGRAFKTVRNSTFFALYLVFVLETL